MQAKPTRACLGVLAERSDMQPRPTDNQQEEETGHSAPVSAFDSALTPATPSEAASTPKRYPAVNPGHSLLPTGSLDANVDGSAPGANTTRAS
ncbi:hypothetical protein CSUB01_05663 [Colletotrichum sublineola]|uniref:Uncharacterized protein n=1 Tax=Colletotrichum sublineola TaxID=1173701 RepID=A0A066X517_COLSU|nr:hypothetical protein CSUB01_05663 [Colletotrichum sublineola]